MNQILAKLIIITSSLLFAASANAIVINESFITTGTGEFTVTNDSNQDIYLFAVASNDATQAEYRPALSGTDLIWDGVVVSKEAWDSGYSFYLGRDIYVDSRRLVSDLNAASSFTSLFGDYDRAIVFFTNMDESTPIVAGSTANGFTFLTSTLASPFMVYGDGGIIETGETVHGVRGVPVPAAVWLFSTGLIGLVGVARRKQN